MGLFNTNDSDIVRIVSIGGQLRLVTGTLRDIVRYIQQDPRQTEQLLSLLVDDAPPKKKE